MNGQINFHMFYDLKVVINKPFILVREIYCQNIIINYY